jgi:hypothetical protein
MKKWVLALIVIFLIVIVAVAFYIASLLYFHSGLVDTNRLATKCMGFSYFEWKQNSTSGTGIRSVQIINGNQDVRIIGIAFSEVATLQTPTSIVVDGSAVTSQDYITAGKEITITLGGTTVKQVSIKYDVRNGMSNLIDSCILNVG